MGHKTVKRKEKEFSGKGKCRDYPFGRRRTVQGKERAPRSARKNGKWWLSECTEQDLERAEI